MSAGSRPPLQREFTLGHPLAVALMALSRERGYEAVEVAEITARAGVERAEFEEAFTGKDALTLRVMEVGSRELQGRVGSAFAGGGRWPASLRAAAWELARWIDQNPTAIWFGMVGVLGAGEMTLVRREELFRFFGELVDAGREVAPDPASVPPAAPMMAVGAIVELLRRDLDGPGMKALPTLVPEMMALAVRPYLGDTAARAELAIPPPADLRGGP